MKKLFFLSFLLFIISTVVFSQNYTISGHITDSKNGETLISSSVLDSRSGKGTVTNAYGFYSLTVPRGVVDIQYSYVGFEIQSRNFRLTKDTVINISLTESTQLTEITVVGTRKEIGVKGSQMSAIEIPISQLKSVPTLFGETDILKALQLLPGVQAGTEGSSGFYVRGGGPDENLFLLDGVPVYNVNHMAGFLSVFNADAIKNVTLYKGGFPARFGGRLSSVLDMRMNDGNNRKIQGNFSVGLISSKFNLEGPLLNDKTTFNISGRRTYFDILAQPLIRLAAKSSGDIDKFSAGYYFYDLNAKVTHKFSETDKLYISTYLGDDVIYSNIRESYRSDDSGSSENRLKLGWNWGNIITAARWNHLITNKLFMDASATYTRYRFDMNVGLSSEQTSKAAPFYMYTESTLGYNSGIEDFGAKVDFDYAPNPNNDIKFGASYTNHTFRPGVKRFKLEFQNDSTQSKNEISIGDENILAHETAMYFEDNINIGQVLKANVGLHYSTFYVQNRFYQSPQPRLSMRALISDNLSVKAGYAMMTQYIHLLSNSNISLPTDLWVPVTRKVIPMQSDQYSAGIFYNLNNIVDLSIESYYKSMNNLIEYRDGASFMNSDTGWEEKIYSGKGWSYGIEFLAQKSVGKTTGWIGYTWSKSERLFNRPGEEINNGEVFPAKFDRRNDLSIVVSHKFSKKIDVSGTWVYSTGNSGSLGLQNYYAYPIDGNFNTGIDRGNFHYDNSIPNINKRNNYRLPDYHRLDLSINFHKQLKHGIRTWNFSVYNAYNHKNPFLIYVKTNYPYNPATGTVEARKSLNKLTLFPIIPSVSYSYKF